MDVPFDVVRRNDVAPIATGSKTSGFLFTFASRPFLLSALVLVRLPGEGLPATSMPSLSVIVLSSQPVSRAA